MEKISRCITFDNGYSISLQRSNFHYCDEETIEVAIFDKDDNFTPMGILRDNKDVEGWVTSDRLVVILQELKALVPKNKEVESNKKELESDKKELESRQKEVICSTLITR